MFKKEQILQLVTEYITEKHSKKKWIPGVDWVRYAGEYYDSNEYTAAINTLLNEWLVLGQDAIKFETEFPKLFGKEYGLLTNSGSSANLLMMLLNRRKINNVIMPVAGFPTTINPTIQLGYIVHFIDIELDTLNLDIEQLERTAMMLSKYHSNRIALTFAHVLGNPPNMDEVMLLVKKYNLILLEDCCDALGSTYDSKPLGSFGDLATCSFYPAHHITMGEGGFVACKTLEDERILRSYRDWGRGCYCVGKEANLLKDGTCKHRFNNWLSALPEEIFDHKYVYEHIGYNLKPIELQASIGLEQIKKLPKIKEIRIENYNRLMKVFSKYEEYFHLPKETLKSNPSWFAFPLTIRKKAPFKRNEICEFFEKQKIQTRPYFAGNILLHPAYKSYTDFHRNINPIKDFPVATRVTTDTFFLGTSPVITKEMIDYIETVLENFINWKTNDNIH
jgi:CDP-4-dehydro-6-deoxyglucose reductase, E1